MRAMLMMAIWVLAAAAAGEATPPSVAGVEPKAAQLFLDPQFAVERIPDVVYGQGQVTVPAPANRNLLLDIYRPQGAGVPTALPACIVAFGGYFVMPGKYLNGADHDGDGTIDHSTMDQYAYQLARCGYLCVSIDYRLLGEEPVVRPENKAFPAAAAFEDARKAYNWLVANAATYSIDTTRIAIGGYSSGGEVAMLSGYINAGSPSFVNNGPMPVRAVFSLSGSMFAIHKQWIDAGDPPLFLFHGTWDSYIPKEVPDLVAARAGLVGLDYEYWRQDGEDHFYLMNINVQGKTLFRRLLEFLYGKLDLASVPPPAAVAAGVWSRYGE